MPRKRKPEPMPAWFHAFPRNTIDYEGWTVLYDTGSRVFIRIEWGTGDNLMREDIAAGYDDYLNWETYHLKEGPVQAAFRVVSDYDGLLDSVMGDADTLSVKLEDLDAGMVMVKRKDKKTGDIREYVTDVLRDAGLGRPEDLLHVASGL